MAGKNFKGANMKIYVASSWRNPYQPFVVGVLRQDGHEVYDFKDSEGFHWSEMDPNWKDWNPSQYIEGLRHACAERGFGRDMKALQECDVCVYVMPCGPSASMEMGWACGAGKIVIVYIPELREPDLMVKMAHTITSSLDEVRAVLSKQNEILIINTPPTHESLVGKITERKEFLSVGPCPDVVGWEPKIPESK
jgi:hypothetical protein